MKYPEKTDFFMIHCPTTRSVAYKLEPSLVSKLNTSHYVSLVNTRMRFVVKHSKSKGKRIVFQKVERFETESEAYDFLFKKIRRVEDELRLKILLKAGVE